MDEHEAAQRGDATQSLAGLDTANLSKFLRAHLNTTPEAASLSIQRYTQGYSNLTYHVQWGQQDLVLRRPPIGANIHSAHDMEREYRILSNLAPIYPKVPRTVLYCADLSVLGAPFYIMERVEGIILRKQPPAGLTLTQSLMEQLSRAFIENLVTIHSLDYAQTALQSLVRPGSYVERQITGWIQRYAKARTDDFPAIERTGVWLNEHRPPDTGSVLIHNDYKYDNLVLAPADLSQIVAVLDWEMATIGDPLMDLGTTLAYWVEPGDPAELQAARVGVTNWPGNFNRTELVQHYALQSGREVGNMVFYYVFGLFKIAVVGQQIYARYKQGLTADKRFAQLPILIQALGHTALRAIEKKRIDAHI